MSCKYCDGDYFQDRTYDDCLLELVVNKLTKSLEIHYSSDYCCIDYDQKEVLIEYCPFCGDKL